MLDCSTVCNSIAHALELPQSCSKPSTCTWKCKELQNRALPRRILCASIVTTLILSHDKLCKCFSSCNSPFCGLTSKSFVTFVGNDLLIKPIYFVIDAQIHTNWYILRRCQVTVMLSRITGQSCVWTFSSDKQHINIKSPYYRPFVKGTHRWIPPTRDQ